jgi:hypothetical protein
VLARALDLAQGGLHSAPRPLGFAALGAAYTLDGRATDALPLLERGHEVYVLWLLGEGAVRRTPLEMDKVAAHYHQALALADALGMRPLRAHCYRGLGTLYSQTVNLGMCTVPGHRAEGPDAFRSPLISA